MFWGILVKKRNRIPSGNKSKYSGSPRNLHDINQAKNRIKKKVTREPMKRIFRI